MDPLQALLDQLVCGDDERCEAAAIALKAYSGKAIAGLRELAASPDLDTRWWAVRALAEIPDGRVSGILADRLKDPDLSVRQCAALGLRQHPEKAAIPGLRQALQNGDRLLAHLAADALAAIGAPAVHALLDVLEGDSPIARSEVIRVLGATGDPRVIPALFAALDEDSAVIQYWAERGLDRLGVGMMFFV